MINGTVGMLLAPFKQPASWAIAFGKEFDGKLKRWLASADVTLADLKEFVAGDVNHFLLSYSADKQLPRMLLSPTDTTVLHAVLDKMANTGSAEYRAFEGRVTKALLQHLVEAADGGARDAAAPGAFARLGMVEADVAACGDDLWRVLTHHTEVYADTYRTALLTPDAAAADAAK
jgi:hypothetical protein